MTSKEALEKIVEKYDWLGKEYCHLIGKDDKLHKVNQTAFVECLVTPIKQDLKRLEELEIENQDLKDNEKIITDYAYNLVIEKDALKEGIATLTAKNNLLQEECDSIADTNEILLRKIKYLTEQNQELVEKIKKYEREQYKQIR